MAKPILTNRQELEIWLDEFMVEQMHKLHVPGVTFSLVHNGELVLAKGYGYANLEKQVPVSADSTLFRVGSVSKLFTATAIMQLMEKGLVDLNEDVNKYLIDFQIANNYPQPVTIANLLTHTAGFDDRHVGLLALEAEDLEPLGERLAAKMPARVLPPGEVMSYSNYGYALLGYIVESMANILFSQYVDENILQPLKMHHSSFAQPPHLSADVSIGYRYNKNKETYQALPFQYVSIPPAGSLSATATDMAKFAIANLQYGRYKSTRILQEDTAKQMQQQQFTHDPRLTGIGWGFMESFYNGQRAIIHGGGMPGFASLLYLFPCHNIGLFVAGNRKTGIAGELIEQFCTRYLAIEQNISKPSVQDRQSLKRYQGRYLGNRYPRKTLGKTILLWSSPLRLKVESDDSLCIPDTLESPKPIYFRESETLVLRIKDRWNNFAVAQEDNQGNIVALLARNGVFNRLAWYETTTFHWILVWLFMTVFFLGAIADIFFLTKSSGNYFHQLTHLAAMITCGLNFAFIAGLLGVKQQAKNNYRLDLIYGVPKIVTVLLCIPLLTSVLSITLPVSAIFGWLNPEWSFIEQISYSTIAIVSLGFIPFLDYWNLLGFRY